MKEIIYFVVPTECNSPNMEQPFQCMDLVFISTLLRHGYGFYKDTKLLVSTFLNRPVS